MLPPLCFSLWDKYDVICGVDEAGRGPLAGPVVAAACIVPKDIHIEGIFDSKQIDEEQREKAYHQLTNNDRVIWAVHETSHGNLVD